MNSIVAVLFLGVVAIVSSAAVKSSGWGAPPPPPAVVDLEVVAEVAAVGEGGASVNQQLAAGAVGDANVPAIIVDENGAIAYVEQGGEITQVAAAASDGSTQTVNVAEVFNQAGAAEIVNLGAVGADLATVAISGGSDAYGWGALGAGAASLNSVSKKSN